MEKEMAADLNLFSLHYVDLADDQKKITGWLANS